ncbi:MAG: hypothetical protein KJ709_09125 [Nanoarchaeota archaeon]|nr:hypothetical protein [Nanoarchaeota archaeon]
MVIKLTEEEKQLFKEGKLDISKMNEHRKENPVKMVDKDELSKVKQEIREANVFYQQAIQRNKDLYEELKQSRKAKEDCRNRIAELRKKKKGLLGLA